ncbi:MAG: hypothetical protein ACYSYU_10935 [Planctomycetota bacterium]|jgi:hypothetical protein
MSGEHYPWCQSYTGYIASRKSKDGRKFELYKCDNCGATLDWIEIMPAYEDSRKGIQEEIEGRKK